MLLFHHCHFQEVHINVRLYAGSSEYYNGPLIGEGANSCARHWTPQLVAAEQGTPRSAKIHEYAPYHVPTQILSW